MEAAKRPFLFLIDSRGPARSVSGSGWAWTDADYLELNDNVAQDKHNDKDDGDQDLQAQDRNRNHCDTPQEQRQQLDCRFLNAFHSGDSAPGSRTSLLMSPFK